MEVFVCGVLKLRRAPEPEGLCRPGVSKQAPVQEYSGFRSLMAAMASGAGFCLDAQKVK